MAIESSFAGRALKVLADVYSLFYRVARREQTMLVPAVR